MSAQEGRNVAKVLGGSPGFAHSYGICLLNSAELTFLPFSLWSHVLNHEQDVFSM